MLVEHYEWLYVETSKLMDLGWRLIEMGLGWTLVGMYGLCLSFARFWLVNDFVSLWFYEVVVDYGFSSSWRLLVWCKSNASRDMHDDES